MFNIKHIKSLVCISFLSFLSVANANEFEVAHVREQGQDMIVFALDRSFVYKTQQQQQQVMYYLQRCASSARLGGTVVILWEADGRTNSIGPRQWADFLRSIDMMWHAKNVNKTLNCR